MAGVQGRIALPAAPLLAWLVLVGQLLAGLGILLGSVTSGELLSGLFMNLDFLLAGVANPSAFSLVIQAALPDARGGTLAGSVHDPAMLLEIVAGLAAVWVGLALLRRPPEEGGWAGRGPGAW